MFGSWNRSLPRGTGTKPSRTEDVGNKCDKNDIMIAWTIKCFHGQREMGNYCSGFATCVALSSLPPRGSVIMYLFIVVLYIVFVAVF